MGGIAKPRPCFLDQFVKSHVDGDRQVYRNPETGVHYTWDSLHGEIEVFNSRGRHLGAIDAVTGVPLKEAKRGRKIKV